MADVWCIAAEGGGDVVGELVCRDDTSGRWCAAIERGACSLNSSSSRRQLCIPLDDDGILVVAEASVRTSHLDVATCESSGRFETDGRLLVMDVDIARCRANVETIRLGDRRWREVFNAAHDVLVLAIGGGLVVRVSDEEDPYEIEDAQSVWLASPRAGTEVDLTGASSETVAVVVEFRRA